MLIHACSAKILVPGEPNVSYICSRYYRAPELIFGATNYTLSIDVWSTGCVMAELILGQPFFPGESGIDQLVEIIKILGTPSKEQIAAMNASYVEHRFPLIKPHPLSTVSMHAGYVPCAWILNEHVDLYHCQCGSRWFIVSHVAISSPAENYCYWSLVSSFLWSYSWPQYKITRWPTITTRFKLYKRRWAYEKELAFLRGLNISSRIIHSTWFNQKISPSTHGARASRKGNWYSSLWSHSSWSNEDFSLSHLERLLLFIYIYIYKFLLPSSIHQHIYIYTYLVFLFSPTWLMQ